MERKRSEYDLKQEFKKQATEISWVPEMRDYAVREISKERMVDVLEERFARNVSKERARLLKLADLEDNSEYYEGMKKLEDREEERKKAKDAF